MQPALPAVIIVPKKMVAPAAAIAPVAAQAVVAPPLPRPVLPIRFGKLYRNTFPLHKRSQQLKCTSTAMTFIHQIQNAAYRGTIFFPSSNPKFLVESFIAYAGLYVSI